jgi:hypothetical protein
MLTLNVQEKLYTKLKFDFQFSQKWVLQKKKVVTQYKLVSPDIYTDILRSKQ